MHILRQNLATTLLIGPLLDDTDGKTPETALTIAQADVKLSRDGGALAQKNDATACTHDADGYYFCPINATDVGVSGRVRLSVQVAGALPIVHDYMVVSEVAFNSLIGGTDKLQVDVVEVDGVAAGTALADLDDIYTDPRALYTYVGAALLDVFKNLLEGARAFTVDTATLAPTTTEFECTLVGADDNIYQNQMIRFETGPNAGLTFRITSSEGTTANPNNKTKLTVTLMPDAPTNGDEATVYGRST